MCISIQLYNNNNIWYLYCIINIQEAIIYAIIIEFFVICLLDLQAAILANVFILTSLCSSVTRNVSVLSLSIPLRLRSFNCQNVAAALNTLTPTPIPETHPIYESNRVADKWQCTQITITGPHTEAYGLRSVEWDLAAAIFFSGTELHPVRLADSRLGFSNANTRIHH